MAPAMASLVVVFIALVSSPAFATTSNSRLCTNKCCSTVTITCTTAFVVGQNEFYVVPNDTDTRPGAVQTFNAPCTGTENGKYVGLIANAGGGDDFQTAKLDFGGSIITFSGDASSTSTVVYAITGGTGRFTGISGTATERSLGNERCEVTLNGVIQTQC